MRTFSSTDPDTARGNYALDGRHFGSRVALFSILLVAILSIGGWLYYRHMYNEAYGTMRESLSSVAGLKSEGIQNWMNERRGDAEVARSGHVVKDALREPVNSDLRAQAIQ